MHSDSIRRPLLALASAVAALLAAQPASAAADSAAAPARRNADAALVRALQDHSWTLQSATDTAGKPVDALLVQGHPFVMRFEGARVAVQGGCNLMSAGWRLTPQNSLVVARPATTQKACEPALMAADSTMTAALAAPLAVRLETGDAPRLHLVSAAQQTLTFSGQRTSRSLYGVPTRLFLEVAAQRCTPAPQPPATCLQVREVRFDKNGLRSGTPGPWQPFNGEIVGYTHEPGVSNVLRVNRFKRPQATADAPSYVYELDLVVESRVESK
jgi:heat shock protein HslJ